MSQDASRLARLGNRRTIKLRDLPELSIRSPLPRRPNEMISHSEGTIGSGAERVPDLRDVRNRLLAAIPAFEYEQLRPFLEPVILRKRQILQESNQPMAYAYFIEHGAASLFSRTARDGAVEVGIVGRFGLVGVPVVRIAAADLRRILDWAPRLTGALHQYVQALLVQYSQVSLCNVRHPIHERLPRWLLTIRDRIESNEIPATHDLISQALGIRRPGVTEAMAKLEELGAVRRGRGRIFITDPIKLEHAACECYHMIMMEYSRIAEPRMPRPH